MSRIQRIATSVSTQIITGAILTAVWGCFAVAHLRGFVVAGKFNLLIYAIAETLIAIFFLLRTTPTTVAANPFEWVIALLGTFLPLFLRPTTHTLLAAAEVGLILGATMQILGVLSLNRSFAIVPALRELKTKGMYRVVRHPIYASYVVSFSCYLLANFSVANFLIVIFSIALLGLRIYFEERHLGLTPEYRVYQGLTKWRLIPFVF